MPDRRSHRGPHPGDPERFGASRLHTLRRACADLGWLLSGGYAANSSLKLVGDRHALDLRQRQAVARASCATTVAAARAARLQSLGPLPELHVDGFNVLTTIEAALAGGVVLGCADGCYRDVASVHGTWRHVVETPAAVEHLATLLAAAGVEQVVLLLDAPVGNSGRLASLVRELTEARGWPWRVEVVTDPDRELAQRDAVVATADSGILDQGVRWVNLAREAVMKLPRAWLVDLGAPVSQRGSANRSGTEVE
ncbi:MAG TPA: DUF434 domain-containing protein [Planctomycetota bacterium]